MFSRLGRWLFDSAGSENLPERVRDAIRRQQERSEILIGWIQLTIVALVAGVYEGATMAEGLVQEDYSLELDVLLLYGAICIVRLAEKPSFRAASCCSVEVVKGGGGLRLTGLASTEATR